MFMLLGRGYIVIKVAMQVAVATVVMGANS